MLRNSNHDTQPRVAPVTPPYDADTAAALEVLGPPIGIFRVFARRPDRAHGISGWGRYYLSRRCALSLRHRELLILRTTARCGAEYEWGVHVQVFADKAGLHRRADPFGDRRAAGRPVLDRTGRPGRAPRRRRAGPRQRPVRRRLDEPGRRGRRGGRRRRPADLRLVPRDLLRRPGDPDRAGTGRTAVRRRRRTWRLLARRSVETCDPGSLLAARVALAHNLDEPGSRQNSRTAVSRRRPARLRSSRASARQARSKVARCRLSLLPCARVPGSSTPVIRISASGKRPA